MRVAGAGRRSALLQPRAANEAGGGHSRPAQCARLGRHADGVHASPGPHARRGARYAGLHRQPCQPRLSARSLAHCGRADLRLRRHRRHPARCVRLSHGPLRTLRPDRTGRVASGGRVDLSPMVRRGAASAVDHHAAAIGGRRAGAQDGSGVLSVRRGRQARGGGGRLRRGRGGGPAHPRVDRAVRASFPRHAGGARGRGRRHARDRGHAVRRGALSGAACWR